jgi:hypothetical protein
MRAARGTPVDYRRLLNGLIKELAANDAVVLEEPYLGQGLSPTKAKKIAADHGLVLADPVLEFFTQINGGVIEWRLAPKAAARLSLRKTSDTKSIRGRAYFYRLDELTPESTSLLDTPFQEGLSNPTRLRAFRPFDKNVEEAVAGFMVARGQLPDRLVYIRQYEDVVALNATLREYVEALVQSRAFLWWQDTFAARPGGLEVSDLYHYVPQLFPGATLDRFR